MRLIACLSVLVLAVLGLGAQESGAGPDIGTVDVTAQVYSPLALVPAGSVTVVTAAEIERSGASTAADALAAVPGLTVNGYGEGGSAATVSIGASTSNQVLVIMDGVRLNDPLNGAPDLNQIPAESISKIEVLQGGASAAYGADALGGVVVITTKKSGRSRLDLGVTNTAYPTAIGLGGASSMADGQKFTMDSGTKIGLADLAVSAQAERGANAYDYSAAGSTALRSNAQFWNAGGNLSLGLPFAGGRLAATAMGSYQNAGVPGSLDYPSSDATQINTAARGSLGWSNDAMAGGALSLDILGHGSYSTMDYSEPSYSYSNNYQISSTGLDIRAVDSVASFCSLGFGATGLYDAAVEPVFDSRSAGQPSRLSLGSYIEPTFFLGDRLKVTFSLRYDWNNSYEAGFSEMLGAVYRLSAALDVRLSGGRSFRAPTFADLYWPYDPVDGYYGNPDLKPETAWSGELGGDLKTGRFSLSASVRARYVDNMIDSTYYDSSTGMETAVNLGPVFIPGADLDAGYEIGPARLSAGYEFVYPMDISGGTSILDSPVLKTYSQHTVKASADFTFGKATAGLTARYWSDYVNIDSYSGTQYPLSGAIVLDLHNSLVIAQGTKLIFDIDNLLDQQYQVIYGYPMPGITLKLGMLVNL